MRALFAHDIATAVDDAFGLDASEAAALARFACDVRPATMGHPLALARRIIATDFVHDACGAPADVADVAAVIGRACRDFVRFTRMQLTLPGLEAMVPQPCQQAQGQATDWRDHNVRAEAAFQAKRVEAAAPASAPCPATGGNMLAFWACYRAALCDAKALGKLPANPPAQEVADRAKAHVQAKGWGMICLDRKGGACLWAAARKMGLRKAATSQRELRAFLEAVAAERGPVANEATA